MLINTRLEKRLIKADLVAIDLAFSSMTSAVNPYFNK
jgi:hypothetical protein